MGIEKVRQWRFQSKNKSGYENTVVITFNLDTPRIEEIQEINPFSQENLVQKTILFLGPSLWNSLPELKET